MIGTSGCPYAKHHWK